MASLKKSRSLATNLRNPRKTTPHSALLIPHYSALLTQKKGMITMTDTHETDCSETSCKDDLMQGLMALFAQADAAETAEDDASAEE